MTLSDGSALRKHYKYYQRKGQPLEVSEAKENYWKSGSLFIEGPWKESIMLKQALWLVVMVLGNTSLLKKVEHH